ncbi:hypothetical protein MP228_000962 [Amoeboaphelidium protococcarum]|nr:hypothetical protein MP228_000962 [Amoeboaphelidium protococcarum]
MSSSSSNQSTSPSRSTSRDSSHHEGQSSPAAKRGHNRSLSSGISLISNNQLANNHRRKESLSQKFQSLARKTSLQYQSGQGILANITGGLNKDDQESLCQENQHNLLVSMNPQDYELGSVVGYGSSATVYIAKFKPTDAQVAIKMIDLDMFERNQIDELRRELQIMTLCRHANLLPVYASFVKDHFLYIVAPFIEVGSCLDILRNGFQDGLDEVSIATILKQALQGLDYLHRNNHIHRDVKSGNLLIDSDGSVYLADFGVSSSLAEYGERGSQRKTFVGTPCFIAPEVLSTGQSKSGYDCKADIWSFGITALELAYGRAPYSHYPPLKVLMLTLNHDPPRLDRDGANHKYSKSFQQMIDACLVKDPRKRLSAKKLLEHAFFKQAKRKDYLVKTLLDHVKPLLERNVKKPNESQKSSGRGVSWDFSTVEADALNRMMEKVGMEEQAGSLPADKENQNQNQQAGKQSSTVKKGRFNVSESTELDAAQAEDQPYPQSGDFKNDDNTETMKRVPINSNGKKSRFKVTFE